VIKLKNAIDFANDLKQVYEDNFLGYLVFVKENIISVVVVFDKIRVPRFEESARIIGIAKQYISVEKASIIEVKELKKFLKDKKVHEYYGRLLMIYDETGKIFKDLL